MITYRKANRNIRKVFSARTVGEFEAGTVWYRGGAEIIDDIAMRAECDPELVSHVIAVLSPSLQWKTNVNAARGLFQCFINAEEDLDSLVLPGYPQNVQKAKEMVRRWYAGDSSWRTILSGPKVEQFARDLLDNDIHREITIDVHIFSAASGIRYTTRNCPEIRMAERKAINRVFNTLGKETGLLPRQVQAIVWLTWRRLIKEGF